MIATLKFKSPKEALPKPDTLVLAVGKAGCWHLCCHSANPLLPLGGWYDPGNMRPVSVKLWAALPEVSV